MNEELMRLEYEKDEPLLESPHTKFKSGNNIPVSLAHITKDEYDAVNRRLISPMCEKESDD